MLRRTLAGATACLLLFAACASDPAPREPLTFDRDLAAKVLERKQDYLLPPVPLRQLTAFDWDTVFCYPFATPADKINRDVGSTILDPGTRFSASALLCVFAKDDDVIKVTQLPELDLAPGKQPAGVVLSGGALMAPDKVPSPPPPWIDCLKLCVSPSPPIPH